MAEILHAEVSHMLLIIPAKKFSLATQYGRLIKGLLMFSF